MSTDFRELARQKAAKYGLIPTVFERQIEAESGFNPRAVSSAGARGIAQIMPATARGWGVNPDDPVAALDAAARNMSGYIKTYLGGKKPSSVTDPVALRQAYEKGLRAYNAGPGAVEASRKYAETNRYVQKIIGPDKFSFTEELKGKKPAEVSQAPSQQQSTVAAAPGGRTFILVEDQDTPTSIDFLKDFTEKRPEIKTGIDPVAILTNFFIQNQNQNYQGEQG